MRDSRRDLTRPPWVRLGLVCGIASSLLYVGADVLAAIRYPDYHRFASQAVSELSAVGAPTRRLVVPVFLAYSLAALAFGVAVWSSAGRSRALACTGGLLVGLGLVDLAAPLFPMHLRGTEATLTDAMHILLTAVTVLLIVLAMLCGAAARGGRFRVYSVVTIATLVACGALTTLDARALAAQQPTPWLGVTERVLIGAYLLWQVVLAATLLRASPETFVFDRRRVRGSGHGGQNTRDIVLREN
jgi:Protein of unknown function (DUF998)